MPLDTNLSSAERTAAAGVSVRPSAPIELSALCCTCSSSKPPKVEIPPALGDRVSRFWDDGYGTLAEPVVLAWATGSLDDTAVEPFLSRLGRPVRIESPLPLETEPEDERDAICARLARLASDRRLRTRYARLMHDLWAVAGEGWAARGLPRAATVAESWRARLGAGADALSLLPQGHHIALREPFPAMVRRAQRAGHLRITPVVNGHGHIVALPGLLSVAAYADAEPPEVVRRRVATEIVGRLRPLSDPTRVTILAQLAHAPAGVGELADTLHIAQPTASVHLRQLREAGLVAVRREGTRTVYSARAEDVEELLADVAERLTRSMGIAVGEGAAV
jgi:DNA-binding transcriptional ArsR family regulator